MRGPPPTPTPILEGRGSWRATTRRGELRPPVEIPEAPAFLTGEAAAEWDRQTTELARLGVIAKLDRAALVVYCDAWASFAAASEALAAAPATPKRSKGKRRRPRGLNATKRRSLERDKRAAAEMLLKLAGQFGFTPAARTRIRPSPDASVDPFLDFLRGKAPSRN